MNYHKTKIKEGITLHTIQTKTFKTNLIAVFLSMPLERDTVTKNTLVNMVLRRGSKTMPSQEAISMELEEMYGASFDCGIEKTGDNHVMKFYLESINNEFLPEQEELLKQSIDKILEIILNPLVEDGGFHTAYLKGEKANLRQIIQGRKDNKSSYALSRCIEEMYQDKPYGLYKYGYIEDLDGIDAKGLYDYYKKLISECKMDIFVSGNIAENLEKIVKENELIQTLVQRKPNYIVNNEQTEDKEEKKEPRIVEDKLEVSQGKLIIGMNIKEQSLDSKHVAIVYNTILGGSANSKMFQNVREKANLAYVAGSSYVRQKNNIFVQCGIEIENYEKALDIVKEQIEAMKKGNFSEEDLQNAKESIIATIRGIPDEQDTEITYYLGQELSDSHLSFEEYSKKVSQVTKEQVVDLADKIEIDTIYFLRN